VSNELKRLAEDFRAKNPALAPDVVVDDAGVWLRLGGTDYGVYSATILGGKPVRVWDGQKSFVHRPSPRCEVVLSAAGPSVPGGVDSAFCGRVDGHGGAHSANRPLGGARP